MYRNKAFTLIELLVVISIIALLIGILLPALGAARRTAKQMQNGTRLRGIHQQLVTFARSNKGWYAGIRSNGDIYNDGSGPSEAIVGNGWIAGDSNCDFPGGRYAIMIDKDYFGADYAISPLEDATKTDWDPAPALNAMTDDNYSYMMLAIGDNESSKKEWSDTINSQAAVLADRVILNGTYGGANAVRSIHTSPELHFNDWRGNIVYNDNRTTFETTTYVSEATTGNQTLYGDGVANAVDNLFDLWQASDVDGTGAMIWSSSSPHFDP